MERDWNPSAYDAFAAARQRPAADLVRAIPNIDCSHISDLGCGSGLSTSLLAERWPNANLNGLDRSAAMLVEARKRVPNATFLEGSIESFAADVPQDLLFANASLHWLHDHETLLPRLLENLRTGGVLAIQMPDNLGEPSHRLMEEVAHEAAFRSELNNLGGKRGALPDSATYYDVLAPHCSSVEIFAVHYRHRLNRAEAIADFFAATGLKPYLDRLGAGLRETFLERYCDRLREAYPQRIDGNVLLTLPRLFIIATRS